MEIKNYDIVEYRGKLHRVMRRDNPSKKLKLSGTDKWIHESKVQLVESYQPKTFKVGDKVIVNQIPTSEKMQYTGGWIWEMDDVIDSKNICPVLSYSKNSDIYELDFGFYSFWFAAYHLDVVVDYDFV